jgi:hypothetical protein
MVNNLVVRARTLLRRYHEDQEGLEVVQAILLLILGVIVLIVLYKFVTWVITWLNSSKDTMKQGGEGVGNSNF